MIIIVLGELKAPSVQQVPSITIVVLCCIMFVWGSVIWLQVRCVSVVVRTHSPPCRVSVVVERYSIVLLIPLSSRFN